MPLLVAYREGFQYKILVRYFTAQYLLSSQFVCKNINTLKTEVLCIIWYGNGTLSLIVREDKMVWIGEMKKACFIQKNQKEHRSIDKII